MPILRPLAVPALCLASLSWVPPKPPLPAMATEDDPPPAAQQDGADAAAQPDADAGIDGGIDEMIAGLYGAISGPAKTPRDWERLRGVVLEPAPMLSLAVDPQGQPSHRLLDLNGYITLAGPTLVDIGFREVETRRHVTRSGRHALIASEYASFKGDEAEPFDRGVNFIHAAELDGTWRVLSISWHRIAGPAEADHLFTPVTR